MTNYTEESSVVSLNEITVISIEERNAIINRALNNFNLDITKANEFIEKTNNISLATHTFKEVQEAWRIIRDARLDTEKTGKALREFSNEYNKITKNRENELIAILSPSENRLYIEKKRYEDEQERIKEDKKRLELEALQKRVNELNALNVSLDLDYLKALSEETYQNILQHHQEDFAKEQEEKRLEEERIAKILEEERIKKETEAALEKAKIEAEREEARLIREQLENERKKVADLLLEKENKEKEEIREKERKLEEERRITLLKYNEEIKLKQEIENKTFIENAKRDFAHFDLVRTDIQSLQIKINTVVPLSTLSEQVNNKIKSKLSEIVTDINDFMHRINKV